MQKPGVIFYITGTSGAGKSTLAEELRKRHLPEIAVMDLDAYGVPEDVDTRWRQEKTKESLQTAVENLKKGFSTAVCGVSVPEEVKMSPLYADFAQQIYFGLVMISEALIEERLTKRGWQKSLIDDNVIWAQHLKKFVEDEKQRFFLVNGEHKSPQQLADWMLAKLEAAKLEVVKTKERSSFGLE